MYLDTAVLVKLVAPEPDSVHWARLVDGQIQWSSELALTEAYAALIRKQREGALTTVRRNKAWKQIETYVAERALSLVPLGRPLLHAANELLDKCHPRVALRTLDALHLASAQECRSWPLCTNDDRMRAAALRLGFPVAPLPGE